MRRALKAGLGGAVCPPAVLPIRTPPQERGFPLLGDRSAAQPHEEGRAPRLQKCRRNDAGQGPLVVNQAREMEMDWNRVEGNWKQVKGKIKEKWGNLTDDDLTAINGKRDQLEGKI